MSGTTLILGLGNILMGDDGVGVRAIERLAARVAGMPDVVLMDGGTLSFTLDAEVERAAALIVIDAAQLGRPPGSVRVFEGAEMDRFARTVRKSTVHEVGLVDLLAMATLCGHLPERRALVGVQPQSMQWGDGLSATAERALPHAGDAALALLARWRPLAASA